jgi:hypothetical protein
MRLKPWSARGGIAQSPWPLASVVGSQPHSVRGCVHVLRSIGAGMGGERAWVCGVPGGQTQSGSTAWLGWPASTRGHTCVHENGCASSRTTRRSHNRVKSHQGRRRLSSPQRNAGELGSVEEQREKRSGFFPSQAKGAHAREQVHGHVGMCEGACMRTSWPRPWRRQG